MFRKWIERSTDEWQEMMYEKEWQEELKAQLHDETEELQRMEEELEERKADYEDAKERRDFVQEEVGRLVNEVERRYKAKAEYMAKADKAAVQSRINGSRTCGLM